MFWFLVENDGAFLLAHRKADQPPFADRWVLPGAKPDRGESARDVAERIGRDELGFDVMGVSLFDTIRVDDGDTKLSVDVHRVGFEGTPRYR
jgi:ADP-ribose pyrophosphatase YjhB (NUDIX family)